MALVKLVNSDTLIPLRVKEQWRAPAQEYFDMSVPQIGSFIKYHKFNDENWFVNDYTIYKVIFVTQELQEYVNGDFVEKFEVHVTEVKDEVG